MTMRALWLRSLAAIVAGGVVWLAAQGGGGGGAEAAHGACFSALRLLRHAIAAFEAQHGYLPGRLAPGSADDALGPDQRAALLSLQLTRPRTLTGVPSRSGPLPGLLGVIPGNPYTGSADLVVVPEGTDPVGFAATCRAGWTYLSLAAGDPSGPLPAGFVLPCGSAPDGPVGIGVGSVQEIAFEIEDYERWR